MFSWNKNSWIPTPGKIPHGEGRAPTEVRKPKKVDLIAFEPESKGKHDGEGLVAKNCMV
jgi:hypothetical protein